MTAGEALDIAREALFTILIVSAPVMLVALTVGLTISLLQALTQIQEATLSFVPKILAIFAVLLLALPFMGEQLGAFTNQIMARVGDRGAASVAAPAVPGGG
ncbi:MAG: flagellar biosynthesis protein FliQ [Zavarzinia sp.]|nr:flagellar biosynthesis protein FliQ [Zavarzinia sp.]